MGFPFPAVNQYPTLRSQDWGGGAIVWVGNASGLPAGDGSRPSYPLSSVFGSSGAIAKLAAASKSKYGLSTGGTIITLPGHVESITASTSLTTLGTSALLGTNVIGLGNGNQRPLFNWTAAASALLMNQAGTWFKNVRFNFQATAATVVTAALTTSAADCGFEFCEMTTSTSATQLTTTAITVASGSTRLTFLDCNINGATAATNPTDIITTTAAVDQFTMKRTKIVAGVNATTSGVVNLANAPTDVEIDSCLFNNRKASSTKCFVASANTTGVMNNCRGIIQTTGAAAAFGTLGNLVLEECYAGTLGTAGILIGTPST
jgi:hypothetical protein